jgi:pilus assembly protein CpaB
MIIRVAFFLIMAIGLAGFGLVMWHSTRPPETAQAAAPPPVKIRVLTATKLLRAGTLLKPDDLAEKEILQTTTPTTEAPLTDSRSALAGAMLRRSIGKDDVLHADDVLRPGDHGFLAAVLQPGMRAVTLGVDAITGSAGLIWPGDRVDLILTQTIADAALPAGNRVVAETVLTDVRAIAIDQQVVQGAEADAKNPQSRTVTLEVTPDQAEKVSVAIRLGRLSLALRSATSAPQPTEARSMTWAGDVSPALRIHATRAAPGMVRVFQGAADGKEFKFQ